jgi:protein transport protein SEC31
VASKAPPQFEKHIKDTEKRLNFLYDHLNNGDLLQPDTVAEILQLAELVQAKNYEEAQRLQLEIHKNKMDECENWMAGVKRLITLSKNTV